MARPVEYTKEELEKIRIKMEEYISSTDIPVLAEFAYKNNIRRATLYEHDALTYTREKMKDKKMAQLEIKGLNNEVNPTMAIFSLKQLGWTDKQEVKHSGGVVTAEIPLSEKDEEQYRNNLKAVFGGFYDGSGSQPNTGNDQEPDESNPEYGENPDGDDGE